MPMSYLYGKKFVGPITPIILAIRKEVYSVPYHEIDWNKARDTCAKVRLSKTLLVLDTTLTLEGNIVELCSLLKKYDTAKWTPPDCLLLSSSCKL
jgi:hypothetical protein